MKRDIKKMLDEYQKRYSDEKVSPKHIYLYADDIDQIVKIASEKSGMAFDMNLVYYVCCYAWEAGVIAGSRILKQNR